MATHDNVWNSKHGSGRMSPLISKRLLQAVVAVLGLIPLATGAAGVLVGPAAVMAAPSWPVDLDSHFRFLSGIFLAVGLMFYATIPSIERKTFLFRVAASLIFAGGAGRLVSMLTIGVPAAPHVAGLVLELVVVPMLVLWQTSISKMQHRPLAE